MLLQLEAGATNMSMGEKSSKFPLNLEKNCDVQN